MYKSPKSWQVDPPLRCACRFLGCFGQCRNKSFCSRRAGVGPRAVRLIVAKWTQRETLSETLSTPFGHDRWHPSSFQTDCHWLQSGKQITFVAAIVGAEFLQKIRQGVAEFDHSLSRDGNLGTWTTSGYRLGYLSTDQTHSLTSWFISGRNSVNQWPVLTRRNRPREFSFKSR